MWSDTPCEESTGSLKGRGGHRYAWDARRGKSGYAHVVALENKLGRLLLSGMQANHHCDNPPCINEEHLYEGTQQQNMKDAQERGRFANQKKTCCPKCSGQFAETKDGRRYCPTCKSAHDNAKQKAARSADPEAVKAYKREWYEKNKEAARKYAREWQAKKAAEKKAAAQ